MPEKEMEQNGMETAEMLETMTEKTHRLFKDYFEKATGINLGDVNIEWVDPDLISISQAQDTECRKAVGVTALPRMEAIMFDLFAIARSPKVSASQTEPCIIQEGAVIYAGQPEKTLG